MPLYEHVFLARQDVSTAQVDTLTKEFSGIITENGGKIAKTEYWGLKPLAYKIKKSRKAHYTLLNIDAMPDAVAEMERRMRLSTDIIRHMTIRVDEHESEPSIQMRKSDRDDRGPRGRGGDRGGPRGDRGGDRGDRGGPRGDRGGDRSGPRPPRDDASSSRAPRPPRDDASSSRAPAAAPSPSNTTSEE